MNITLTALMRVCVLPGLAIVLVQTGCSAKGDLDDWASLLNPHNPNSTNQPDPEPLPSMTAATAMLVNACGITQTDTSGLIENTPIVGEGYAAGTTAVAMSPIDLTMVRHGFAPPIPPGWPHGIAKASTHTHVSAN